jgi:hypothetical protein
MGKPPKRWPMWKIGGSGGLCVVAAVVSFWLSGYLRHLGGDEAVPTGSNNIMAIPSFAIILGMTASMLGLFCFGWLGWRIKEARTPVWERKGKTKWR